MIDNRNITERYIEKAARLREAGKSGNECEYCGGTQYQNGKCKGCGAQAKHIFGYFMGVPVTSLGDFVEIQQEIQNMNRYAGYASI